MSARVVLSWYAHGEARALSTHEHLADDMLDVAWLLARMGAERVRVAFGPFVSQEWLWIAPSCTVCGDRVPYGERTCVECRTDDLSVPLFGAVAASEVRP